MPSNVNNIVSGFPHPLIPSHIGIPTYATIAEVNLKLNANAASVQSNLGDGTLGLLALTVTPAVFNTLLNLPFVNPVNPGSQPAILGTKTAAQILAITRAHTEDLRIWREYTSTNKALKQQLLTAFNKMYY